MIENKDKKNNLIKVRLINMTFYAYHGVTDEEQQVGNNYQVDVEVGVALSQPLVDNIEVTINYADVHSVAERVMSVKTRLIETLAIQIAEGVKALSPKAQAVKVAVRKPNPPIGKPCEYSEVVYEL